MLNTAVYTEFNQLPAHFPKFLTEIGKRNFFLSKGWFENFSKNTIDQKTKLRIYTVASDAEKPQARAVLFMRNPGGQNGSYSQRLFSGPSTIASLTAHQSISFAPAISDTDQQYENVVDALVQSMCEDEKLWSLIDLNFLNKKSRIYKSLSKSLSNHGMRVGHYDYRPNIYENLSGTTFKEFISSRPSMVKKTYARKARKLAKTNDVRFELITKSDDLEQAILDYEIVLANSWKEPELFPAHDAGVIQVSSKAGALRLGLLYVNDRPVAAQIWLISAGRATIYKLHYDLEFKQESVGAILMLRMFEHMIDVEHIHEVDFGVGDEAAKSHWLKKKRLLSGIVAFNTQTPAGLLTFSRYSSSRFINMSKQKVKPLLLPLKSASTSIKQARKIRQKFL